MTTRTCPHCAEEIQAAAVRCKHCGQPVGSAPTATTAPPPSVGNGDIHAVVKAFAVPGKWSALVCTPEKLVVKTIIPAAVGTGVPLACLVIIIFSFAVSLLAVVATQVVFTQMQKRRVEEWAQRKQLRTLRDANDRTFDVTDIHRLVIANSVGRKKVIIAHTRGQEVLFLNGADAERLARLYPLLVGEQ